nr:WbqC family protein [uncultured Vibrio sp.]
MKKLAILQSNYIPWKGYFDLIKKSDLFVFHDDLQYTKNDWRNRNKIKTAKGTEWLSIPCGTNEKRLICEVPLNDKKWVNKHKNKIISEYKDCPYFDEYKFVLDYIYDNKWDNLSDFNQSVIKFISKEVLGFKTEFMDSRELDLKEKKQERVLEILEKLGYHYYISGPAAKDYIDENKFTSKGIEIEWMDYSHYPEYPQKHGEFEHAVSILDLIFNTGKNAKDYIS